MSRPISSIVKCLAPSAGSRSVALISTIFQYPDPSAMLHQRPIRRYPNVASRSAGFPSVPARKHCPPAPRPISRTFHFVGEATVLLKGIIRPFPKIFELFSGNDRQSWRMAGSDVFYLKIALLAYARPSKLIRLPTSSCAKQIARTCRKSL